MHDISSYEYLLSQTKRNLDLIGSVALLGFSSPLMMVAGAISAFDTFPMGPIFKQERVGLDSTKFNVYKIRTINNPDEAQNPTVEGTFHPNASMVGMLMRKSGIDELPQLLNVVKGDMSLVGPRPLVQPEINRLKSISKTLFNQWFEVYSSIKPGISGPSQIFRKQHKVNTNEVWEETMRLDIDYANNASLPLDLKILGSTPVKLLISVIKSPK